jgi:hypothetical protein
VKAEAADADAADHEEAFSPIERHRGREITATNARSTRVTVIPCMRYRDGPAAIEWLGEAFGVREATRRP